MLTPEGEGGGNGGFDSSFEEQVAGVGRNRPEDGQQKQHGHQTHHHHRVNVVKAAAKTTKVAAKTTKGLLGYVGSVAQRTVESLTHQEVTIGLRRVQIVKEMAEGGGWISIGGAAIWCISRGTQDVRRDRAVCVHK